MSIDYELDERPDQPLVVMGRDVIIENEILTIHRIMPRTTRRGQGKEFWLAETYVNDTLQSIRIWYEEIRVFTDAGYDKAIFDSREPITVNIQVLPKLKYGKWHVGEVYTKADDNGVVLLSNAERQQQWIADCADYGSPKLNAITATFYHKDYGAVSWWKNKAGTYTRQGRNDTRMYAAKDPETVIVDDEAWIRHSMPAQYREMV